MDTEQKKMCPFLNELCIGEKCALSLDHTITVSSKELGVENLEWKLSSRFPSFPCMIAAIGTAVVLKLRGLERLA